MHLLLGPGRLGGRGQVVDRDVGAVLGEPHGGRLADPGGAAGHQDVLAQQVRHSPAARSGVNGVRGRRHPLLFAGSAGRRAHRRPPSADRAASSATPNTRCDVDSHATAAGRQPPRGALDAERGEKRAVGARVDRDTRECAPCPARRRPAARGSAIRHTETRARAVVDHLLGAKPLRHRSPAADHAGRAVDEDRGRHVLGMPARIGAHILLLARGGRQNRLGERLQARLGKRLDPRRHKTGDHTFRCHQQNVAWRQAALEHDRVSAGKEPRSPSPGPTLDHRRDMAGRAALARSA